MSVNDKSEEGTCKFLELCAALQRNDPNITEIDGTTPMYLRTGRTTESFPKGYGLPLGESLRNNTYVRKLQLNVDHLLPLGRFGVETFTNERIQTEIDALLHFIAQSKTLSAVSLWCHNVTEFLTPTRQRLADELLSAVVRNPSITEVAARVKFYSWRRLHQSLLSAQHVKSLKLHLHIDDASSYSSKVPIAAAIGSLLGLERLFLNEETDIRSSLILAQLRQSCNAQSQLKELVVPYDGTPGCLSALNTFVGSSSSLQNLHIHNFPFVGAQYVEGLFHCRSLTHLSMQNCRLDYAATGTFTTWIRHENRHSVRYLRLVNCILYAKTKKLPKTSAEARLLTGSPLEDLTLAFGDRKENICRDSNCANVDSNRVDEPLRIACDNVDYESLAQFLSSCDSIHRLGSESSSD